MTLDTHHGRPHLPPPVAHTHVIDLFAYPSLPADKSQSAESPGCCTLHVPSVDEADVLDNTEPFTSRRRCVGIRQVSVEIY